MTEGRFHGPFSKFNSHARSDWGWKHQYDLPGMVTGM
jgi:hypothetical protein